MLNYINNLVYLYSSRESVRPLVLVPPDKYTLWIPRPHAHMGHGCYVQFQPI